jgi:hypothetical protein
VVKRRRGRPRKNGQRYRSGKLKTPHESPLTTARQQPHRKGLGDKVLDQRAESALGRMYLREALTEVQLLAAERYAGLWRSYVATLGGPAWPGKATGRVSGCDGCPTTRQRRNCACALASRSWRHCWDRLALEGCAVLVTQVACYDMVCPPERFAQLCTGLDALAYQLGLTNQRKGHFLNASSKNRSATDP